MIKQRVFGTLFLILFVFIAVFGVFIFVSNRLSSSAKAIFSLVYFVISFVLFVLGIYYLVKSEYALRRKLMKSLENKSL